jgi:hypothetical protein
MPLEMKAVNRGEKLTSAVQYPGIATGRLRGWNSSPCRV